MQALIFSNTNLIGTVELKGGDISMGHVYGQIIPTPSYYSDIQERVHSFWEKPESQDWKKLKLNVMLENGLFLFGVGGITINDIKELPNEPISIDIAGISSEIIHDFIATEEARPFIEEPWESISIERKLELEKELCKELGMDKEHKSFLSFLIPKKDFKHILLNCEFSALCKDGRSDDILFAIHNVQTDSPKEYAVVSLTYKGKQELNGWPITKLYTNFDDFKYNRMYRDKADWED